MALLLAGNLSGAREKVARCLKPPVDRNQLNLGAPLLQEVVQHLETHSPPTLGPVGRNITAAGVQELHNLEYSYSIHAIFFSSSFYLLLLVLNGLNRNTHRHYEKAKSDGNVPALTDVCTFFRLS